MGRNGAFSHAGNMLTASLAGYAGADSANPAKAAVFHWASVGLESSRRQSSQPNRIAAPPVHRMPMISMGGTTTTA